MHRKESLAGSLASQQKSLKQLQQQVKQMEVQAARIDQTVGSDLLVARC